jgi:transcriptional regulator
MLIHPWDAALDSAERQDWLASTDRFGMLTVNNLDPAPVRAVVSAARSRDPHPRPDPP